MTRLIDAVEVGFTVARLNTAGEAVYAATVTELRRGTGMIRAAVVGRVEYARRYDGDGRSQGDSGLSGIALMTDERQAEIETNSVRRVLDRKLNEMLEDHRDMSPTEQSRLLALLKQFRYDLVAE